MKKTDKFFYRLAMPFPMACPEVDGAIEDKEVNGVTYPGFTEIAKDSVDGAGKLNFQQGFPGVYSVPKSNGGQYVTRGQMNAIGNLASQNQFYFMAGGLNTFDKDFCDAIGGYPKDAILTFLNGNFLYYVISLVDDNKIDFRLGVDGINWRLLTATQDYVSDGDIFFEGGRDVGLGDSILGIVTARKTSYLTVKTSIAGDIGENPSYYFRLDNPNAETKSFFHGLSLAIKEITEGVHVEFPQTGQPNQDATWNGWMELTGNFSYTFAASRASAYGMQKHTWSCDPFTSKVEEGKTYAIALLGGDASSPAAIYDEALNPGTVSSSDWIMAKYYTNTYGSVKITYS